MPGAGYRVGRSTSLGPPGFACSPQRGEWHIHSRGHARPAAGGARPSARATCRGAASRPRATCGHSGHQEILRSSSFNHISSQLSRQGDSYQGPFPMLERGLKIFRLQLGKHEDNISRDHLKPH